MSLTILIRCPVTAATVSVPARLSDVFGICVFLGLAPLNDKSYWRRCIERPLKARSDSGLKALKVCLWGFESFFPRFAVCGKRGVVALH
jgi:hypothetical protein